MPFNIIIVGTGIAGLAAAIALSDKGHAVTVVEATSQLKAIGGIIVLQPNANRVMDRLGVYQDMLGVSGVRPMPGGVKRYADGEWQTYRSSQDWVKEFGYP
jgi:salicylate hydroxylase